MYFVGDRFAGLDRSVIMCAVRNWAISALSWLSVRDRLHTETGVKSASTAHAPTTLIRTKFHRPLSPHDLVDRPRLIDQAHLQPRIVPCTW